MFGVLAVVLHALGEAAAIAEGRARLVASAVGAGVVVAIVLASVAPASPLVAAAWGAVVGESVTALLVLRSSPSLRRALLSRCRSLGTQPLVVAATLVSVRLLTDGAGPSTAAGLVAVVSAAGVLTIVGIVLAASNLRLRAQ